MTSELLFSALMIGIAVVSWNAFPQRVVRDVAEWEITQQQGRRYIFMYRSWSVGFALVGVVLTILTLAGK